MGSIGLARCATPSENIAAATLTGFMCGLTAAGIIGGPQSALHPLFFGGAIGGGIGCAIGWYFRHVGSNPKTGEPKSDTEEHANAGSRQ